MTNTEIAEARWVTASSARNTSYDMVSELLRVDADPDEVAELFLALQHLRGAHKVEVRRDHADYVAGERVESPWFSIIFRGTDRAVDSAREALNESGLKNPDRNANHDHERCLAAAREAGVPASWAHRIETYLST